MPDPAVGHSELAPVKSALHDLNGPGMEMLHCSWWLGALMTGSLPGEAKGAGNPRLTDVLPAISSPCKGWQMLGKE